jgi:hypothetical protein
VNQYDTAPVRRLFREEGPVRAVSLFLRKILDIPHLGAYRSARSASALFSFFSLEREPSLLSNVDGSASSP